MGVISPKCPSPHWLYPPPTAALGLGSAPMVAGELAADYRELRALIGALVQVLVDKDVVSVEEIAAAAEAVDTDGAPLES